jgi:Tol biopolymer transport system component
MATARRLLAVVAGVALVMLSVARPGASPEFYDWSLPINIGPPVNTPLPETAPFISRNGRSLYFVRSAAAGGFGGQDIWVSQRARVHDAWDPPQNLGPAINTPFDDFGPTLSPDGHLLYFSSNRPGFGGNDLYISRRHNRRNDFGWRPATNLGGAINTAANDIAAVHFEDHRTGVISLYFASNRPGGLGADDIYVSTLLPDETFGAPVLVEELSTTSSDLQPAISRDGLEMFLSSSRPGTLGSLDLWVSTRRRTTDPWSVPMNLGAPVNSPGADARASLSLNGTELYFQSNRDGNADVYRSTRSRVRDRWHPRHLPRR